MPRACMSFPGWPCLMLTLGVTLPAWIFSTSMINADHPTGQSNDQLAGQATTQAGQAADQVMLDFDRQIRPLLSDNCFSCHGPDAAVRQADLRLDLREAAIAGGAIDLQQLSQSTLIERIMTDDPEQVMPPPKSNKRLSDVQKQLLRQWVEQGAPYTQHWAFTAPSRPDVPADQHPIDYLIHKQLTSQGLNFSAPADTLTLARRLSLDLVGLPPVLGDLERLLSDPSPAQIERYIDQLIASPHYGERMAITWLDAVRFADTIGYHSDTPRNVHPYRDYVIDSFNRNKPFDQFTIEQIAGDLLPEATQEQKIASCFNRLLLTTEEGGAQAKDYEARYLGDRVRAIGTVWLGLTTGCAQCHDHKFDPITMHDFYALGAFFADIEEVIIGKREEGMPAPSPAQAQQLQHYKVALAALQAEFSAPHPRLADQQLKWEQEQIELDAAARAWQTLTVTKAIANADTVLTIQPEHSILANGPRPDKVIYEILLAVTQHSAPQNSETVLPSTVIEALRLEALPHSQLPAGGSGRADNGNFVLTEVTAALQRADGSSIPLKFASARASIEQSAAANKHPDKKWSAASTIDNDTRGDQWGWAILPDVTQAQQLQLKLEQPIELSSEDRLLVRMHQLHGNNGHVLGHFRWSAASDANSFVAPLADKQSAELLSILKVPAAQRSEAQAERVRAAFHEVAPGLSGLRERLAAAQKQLDQFQAALPKCLISKSMPQPRVVRILPRGNWQDESGPIVGPALPAFLTSARQQSDRKLNRLDLASWLVESEHPLTARVQVNRLWKQFFGTGLSKNLDDLGAQGEAPLHAELLDYLATEFVQSGWNIKQLVRLIVTSRAYQQSSAATPEQLALDPENRLLARQSRFRLPAELVRDNALAISGLLSDEIGGPSVKPYQPEGYWENLNFPPRQYQADPAPLQHRRGLYVWWQRSFVHPSMLAFDAPTREECAVDRPQSNIPQQALVLLNDPTYFEAARSLSQRISKSVESDVAAGLASAFRLATARHPTPAELELLMQLYDQAIEQYAADPAAAIEIVGSPTPTGSTTTGSTTTGSAQAATIQVCRAILNLHEVITRN